MCRSSFALPGIFQVAPKQQLDTEALHDAGGQLPFWFVQFLYRCYLLRGHERKIWGFTFSYLSFQVKDEASLHL